MSSEIIKKRTSTDYSGRTVDLLILQFVDSPKTDIKVSPDVSKYPRMTAGIEKLVQRYALLFLTQVGTVKNMEREGTSFMQKLGSGFIYDESTLESAAAEANKAVVSLIRSEDSALDTDPDEALSTARVIDTHVDRGTASVHVTVEIVSVSGDRIVYIMPLKSGV